MDQDTIIESLIAGIAAGGLAAGTAAMLRLNFPPDAVLGFVGGVSGAFVAIGGTLWYDRARERAARARELEYLRIKLTALARIYREAIPKIDKSISTEVIESLNYIKLSSNLFNEAIQIVLDKSNHITAMDRLILNQSSRVIVNFIDQFSNISQKAPESIVTFYAKGLRNTLELGAGQFQAAVDTIDVNGPAILLRATAMTARRSSLGA